MLYSNVCLFKIFKHIHHLQNTIMLNLFHHKKSVFIYGFAGRSQQKVRTYFTRNL